MTDTRTYEDLMREAPDLAGPIGLLDAAGAVFAPVVDSEGSFSRVDLSGLTPKAIEMHVGYRATTPRAARVLIRESVFGPNRIVMDMTAAGWKIATNCDREAKPWFVGLIHLIFKISEQDCAKQDGRDHRSRHDLVTSEINEYLIGFLGMLATPGASAR